MYAALHGWVAAGYRNAADTLDVQAAPEAALALVVQGELRAGAWAGSAVLALSIAGVIALAWTIRRHPPRPHPARRLPAERLWSGTLAGFRYAWHSQTVFAQLVRTAAYGATGSALWALLPAIGAQRLGSGASGYGLMMGCLGGGAVITSFFIGRLRSGLGLERLIVAGVLTFSLAMVVSALSPVAWPVYLALAASGAAWMAVMSTFNTATQTSAPPWIRSRAAALHVLAALGAFALGSALWGAVAGLTSLPVALLAATVAMLAGLLLAKPFPLRMGEHLEVTPAPLEHLPMPHEPDPEAGPVAVELVYRVRPEAVDAFVADVTRLKAPRQRDGALFWRLYRDLADPQRFVERFIVQSWVDYLHQRSRQTLADRELEAALHTHLSEGSAIETRHYLAER
jgi:hypothetical protein